MALLIYVAQSDGVVDAEEKDMIMKELKFQLDQRHFEYETLAEEIGPDEMKILNHLFEQFKTEIAEKSCDLDEIIRIINMIYKKNPYKRMFLVRLCYYVAYADKNFPKRNLIRLKKSQKNFRLHKKIRTELSGKYVKILKYKNLKFTVDIIKGYMIFFV